MREHDKKALDTHWTKGVDKWLVLAAILKYFFSLFFFMYPQSHFLFPLLLGLILQKLGYVDPYWVVIAVLVGVFIDLDHPIKHFFLTGELNLEKAWNAGLVKHENDRTFIHHKQGILFLTPLHIIAFAYFPYWTTAIAIGYYSHMLLDHFTVKKGFVDYFPIQDYWGPWKPLRLNMFGFQMAIARHEIVFDVICLFGLLLILL